VEWYDQAACGGQNARTFDEATPAEAKEICGGCPVRVECVYDALASKATNGIWGGLTYPERRALPALPADRSAALDVLRQHLAAEAAPAPAPTALAAPRPKRSEPKAPAPKKEKPAGRRPEAVPAPREDVAELLRQGHTQRQIMAELKVSHRVVIATRKAYKIPYRKGQGFRYSPEQRAENERRTIELLRRGATCQQVMDEVGISPPTIVAIRRKAGLPTPDNKPGVPARSRAEALARKSEPLGNGHVRWTGSRAGRALQLNAENRSFNVRSVAFEQHHGRSPFGPIRSNCGVTECIAGAHLTDTLLRAAQPEKEEPVTVQALKDLLDEIDQQGGPQAARDNRLTLTAKEPALMPTADTPALDSSSSIAQAMADALPVDNLLAWGDQHSDSDVQDQAARARAALTGLRQRHASDAELAQLATEREQLEKRLTELTARQAELVPAKKPKRKSAAVRDYDTRTVRAWAGANGVDCPRVGQIPKRVLDAWRAATADGGSA